MTDSEANPSPEDRAEILARLFEVAIATFDGFDAAQDRRDVASEKKDGDQ